MGCLSLITFSFCYFLLEFSLVLSQPPLLHVPTVRHTKCLPASMLLKYKWEFSYTYIGSSYINLFDDTLCLKPLKTNKLFPFDCAKALPRSCKHNHYSVTSVKWYLEEFGLCFSSGVPEPTFSTEEEVEGVSSDWYTTYHLSPLGIRSPHNYDWLVYGPPVYFMKTEKSILIWTEARMSMMMFQVANSNEIRLGKNHGFVQGNSYCYRYPKPEFLDQFDYCRVDKFEDLFLCMNFMACVDENTYNAAMGEFRDFYNRDCERQINTTHCAVYGDPKDRTLFRNVKIRNVSSITHTKCLPIMENYDNLITDLLDSILEWLEREFEFIISLAFKLGKVFYSILESKTYFLEILFLSLALVNLGFSPYFALLFIFAFVVFIGFSK